VWGLIYEFIKKPNSFYEAFIGEGNMDEDILKISKEIKKNEKLYQDELNVQNSINRLFVI
jgi:hypothetical protein